VDVEAACAPVFKVFMQDLLRKLDSVGDSASNPLSDKTPERENTHMKLLPEEDQVIM
jgi:hypothetical protein